MKPLNVKYSRSISSMLLTPSCMFMLYIDMLLVFVCKFFFWKREIFLFTIPNFNIIVHAASGNAKLTRRGAVIVGHTRDKMRMSIINGFHAVGCSIVPNFDASIVTARDYVLSCWMEKAVTNPVIVSYKCLYAHTGFEIPQLDCFIPRTADQKHLLICIVAVFVCA